MKLHLKSLFILNIFILNLNITKSISQRRRGGNENNNGASYQTHNSRIFNQRQQCDMPNLKNGHTNIRQRGKLIRFQCNRGYNLIGGTYAGCINGKWDTAIPVCATTGCKKLITPENGIIVGSGGVATLYCKEKYQIAGGRITYCNGTNWDRPLGSCRETLKISQMWCDFETDDICEWTHDIDNNDFEWKRVMGMDTFRRVRTGPQHDHTTLKSNSGHYMLIESSGGNRLPDDSAKLISPLYNSKLNQYLCLRFWYFMYGSTVGNLRIYIKPSELDMDTIIQNPKYLLFEKSGNQKNQWHEAFFNIEQINGDFQIIIEGTAGTGHLSDIAIDDIALLKDNDCFDEYLLTTEQQLLTEEIDGIYDILTCKNRCNETKSITTIRDFDQTNSNGYIIKNCDCHFGCEDIQTCCPDYRNLCGFGITIDNTDDYDDLSDIDITTISINNIEIDNFTNNMKSTIITNLITDINPTTNTINVKNSTDKDELLIDTSINYNNYDENQQESTIKQLINENPLSTTTATIKSNLLTTILIENSKIPLRTTTDEYIDNSTTTSTTSSTTNSTTISTTKNNNFDDTTTDFQLILLTNKPFNDEEFQKSLDTSLPILLFIIFFIILFIIIIFIIIIKYYNKNFTNLIKINYKNKSNNNNSGILNKFNEIHYSISDEKLDFTLQRTDSTTPSSSSSSITNDLKENNNKIILSTSSEQLFDNNKLKLNSIDLQITENLKKNELQQKFKEKSSTIKNYNIRKLNKIRNNLTDENNGLLSDEDDYF